MTVTFRNAKLRKQFENGTIAKQAYSAPVARKYIQRIQLLQAAESLDELLHLPGLDCHPLKGDRAGRYAVKLTGSVRLLFTLKGDKLDIIRIEEVSKHYGD